MKSFDIAKSIEFGWEVTRKHSGLLFKILLTLFAINIAGDIVGRVLPDTFAGFLASLALGILSIVVSAGFMLIALKLAEGKAAHYSDLFPAAMTVWQFFAASVLAGIAIFIGVIALIVPGIFLGVRLAFVRFAAVEGAGITGSFARSWAATEGHWWHLLGFFLVLALLNIVGALCLLVGLLITIPVSVIAWAKVYTTLKHRS